MDKINGAAACDVFRLVPVHNNNNYGYGTDVKPSGVCLMAIIKTPDIHIQNEIGKILKCHNIFDYSFLYKEPDYGSFKKVISYTGLYKASGAWDNSAKADDITVSIITLQYPEKMIYQMNDTGITVEKAEDGVYHARGSMLPTVQIIVSKELSKDCHAWLESLLQYMQGDSAPQIFLEQQVITS